MKKIWVNKTETFESAERFDESYYLSMSKTERLETVQFLRELYFKIKNSEANESRKRLRKVVKVIQ